MIMDAVTIEKYGKGNEAAFVAYVKDAFHPKYILSDPRFLGWQFDTLYIAMINKKIIGHFGFRDVVYKVGSESRKVRVLMNLYVSRAYHKAGVGPLLVKAVFDTPNPVLVSGYNEVSSRLYAHFRSGWKEAGALRRFMKVLDPAHSLVKNCNVPRVSETGTEEKQEFFIEEVHRADSSFDALWSRTRDRYQCTIERSSEYLNWRFFTHPHLRYEVHAIRKSGDLCGFVVSRKEEDQGFGIVRIIDLVASEGYETKLFREVIRRARDEKAAMIDFMHSGSCYDSALAATGFFDTAGTDFAAFPAVFSPISWERTSICVAYDLDQPLDQWYVTKADGDQDRPNPQ